MLVESGVGEEAIDICSGTCARLRDTQRLHERELKTDGPVGFLLLRLVIASGSVNNSSPSSMLAAATTP